MREPKHRTMIAVPLSEHRAVQEEADRAGVTLVALYRRAMQEYLERQRRARARRAS